MLLPDAVRDGVCLAAPGGGPGGKHSGGWWPTDVWHLWLPTVCAAPSPAVPWEAPLESGTPTVANGGSGRHQYFPEGRRHSIPRDAPSQGWGGGGVAIKGPGCTQSVFVAHMHAYRNSDILYPPSVRDLFLTASPCTSRPRCRYWTSARTRPPTHRPRRPRRRRGTSPSTPCPGAGGREVRGKGNRRRLLSFKLMVACQFF